MTKERLDELEGMYGTALMQSITYHEIVALITLAQGLEGEWISVEERLPIMLPEEEVLAWKQGWYWNASYNGKYWQDSEGERIYPTHWRPLPPPPNAPEGRSTGSTVEAAREQEGSAEQDRGERA